jgi:hypothetical protein
MAPKAQFAKNKLADLPPPLIAAVSKFLTDYGALSAESLFRKSVSKAPPASKGDLWHAADDEPSLKQIFEEWQASKAGPAPAAQKEEKKAAIVKKGVGSSDEESDTSSEDESDEDVEMEDAATAGKWTTALEKWPVTLHGDRAVQLDWPDIWS